MSAIRSLATTRGVTGSGERAATRLGARVRAATQIGNGGCTVSPSAGLAGTGTEMATEATTTTVTTTGTTAVTVTVTTVGTTAVTTTVAMTGTMTGPALVPTPGSRIDTVTGTGGDTATVTGCATVIATVSGGGRRRPSTTTRCGAQGTRRTRGAGSRIESESDIAAATMPSPKKRRPVSMPGS